MRDWLSLSLFSSTLLPTTPSPTPTPLSFSFSSSHKHYTLAPWWSGITGGWMWRSWSDVSALSRRLTWSCLPLLGPFFFFFYETQRQTQRSSGWRGRRQQLCVLCKCFWYVDRGCTCRYTNTHRSSPNSVWRALMIRWVARCRVRVLRTVWTVWTAMCN